ncbi:MAG: EAL domain-containing protein [Lautropia sp.]|nr:EAL domain-containing protein [Lautropia sp.]
MKYKKKSAFRQFYESLGRLRQRILVFLLPAAMAGIIMLAHHAWPEWMDLYIWYIAPIALVGMTLFAYSLLNALETLQDERKTRERLEKLQEQYSVAETLGHTGAWVLSLKDNQFHWSKGCFDIFGIDPEHGEPSHRAFLICIHGDDQKAWQKEHRHGIESGKPIRMEYRYVRDGKEIIWIHSEAQVERDEQGEPVRLVGVVADITQEKRMSDAIKANEAKFRALTELSADWDWETDAGFRVTAISDRIQNSNLAEWAKTVVGGYFSDGELFHAPRADWEGLATKLEARKSFEDFQYSFIDASSRVLSVSLSGRAVLDANGQLQGYRGIGRDVTTEARHQLMLRLENLITGLMQQHDDLSQVLQSVITRLCEVMGWRGGALLEIIAGTQSITVVEAEGEDSIRKMLRQLPGQIPLTPNSVEGHAWQGQGGVVPSPGFDPAFAQRYQMEALKIASAFIAPILNEKKEVLSVLMFFSGNRLVNDELARDLVRTLSRMMSQYIQRKRVEEQVRHASLHDALTGLPNRKYLTLQLEKRLAGKQALALLYIDLDRYKAINDTLGHQAGDQVLIEVAQRFRTTIGPNNVAARMGGDEFILLLDGMTDRKEVETLARKILAAVERPFILKDNPHFLSASIGIALAPEQAGDAGTLIKCADQAMYTVKSEGRNDVRFYQPGMKVERSTKVSLTDDLSRAMQAGEVELFYQPVIDSTDLSICGLEGLMRWRHPVEGLLLPDQFLPPAEKSNHMREIGLWTIRRALDDRLKLGLDEYPDLVVSVNLNPMHLNEEGFLAQVRSLLTERNFPANLLRLELTENTLIEASSRIRAQLMALKKLGVQVMIDNFGTGYASLSYLRDLPVSGLKIDHGFIRNLPENSGNAAIVQAIMTLSEKLKLQVIAEGVESPAQMQALRSYHCRMMQGIAFHEPMPMDKLKVELRRKQGASRRAPQPVAG